MELTKESYTAEEVKAMLSSQGIDLDKAKEHLKNQGFRVISEDEFKSKYSDGLQRSKSRLDNIDKAVYDLTGVALPEGVSTDKYVVNAIEELKRRHKDASNGKASQEEVEALRKALQEKETAFESINNEFSEFKTKAEQDSYNARLSSSLDLSGFDLDESVIGAVKLKEIGDFSTKYKRVVDEHKQMLPWLCNMKYARYNNFFFKIRPADTPAGRCR